MSDECSEFLLPAHNRLNFPSLARRYSPTHGSGDRRLLPCDSATRDSQGGGAAVTSGLRKAAVLLMSLPQDEAAAVLSKLKPKQIEAVSIEIARLDQVAGRRAGIGDPRVRRMPTPMRCSAAVAAWMSPSPWWSGPSARTPAPRWTTCGSRSRPCRSAFCRRSTARTC